MSSPSSVLALDARRQLGIIRMERRSLHRFLVAYCTDRGLRPSPALRTLLISAIDVYPGPCPVRATDLAAHLDLVVRAHVPASGKPRAVGGA